MCFQPVSTLLRYICRVFDNMLTTCNSQTTCAIKASLSELSSAIVAADTGEGHSLSSLPDHQAKNTRVTSLGWLSLRKAERGHCTFTWRQSQRGRKRYICGLIPPGGLQMRSPTSLSAAAIASLRITHVVW